MSPIQLLHRFTRLPVTMRWGAAVIVCLTFLAYLPAIDAGFIWDDDAYVTDNLLLRDADGLRRLVEWIVAGQFRTVAVETPAPSDI